MDDWISWFLTVRGSHHSSSAYELWVIVTWVDSTVEYLAARMNVLISGMALDKDGQVGALLPCASELTVSQLLEESL